MLALATAAAQPTISDAPWRGTIELKVDATDLGHRVFEVHETIPVQAGPMTLLYPQWLPGKHRPAGPIEKLAGLSISANGERIPWTRNQMDVYEFDIDVPEGVSSIDVEFQYLSPQDRGQGRVVMTPQMLNLQWNTVVLYPAGYNASQIPVAASVTLPAGWQFGTALEVQSRAGDSVQFKTIDLANLIDSPMFAGKYFKRVDLDPGADVPVHLNIVADAAKYLEISEEQLAIHRELVDQMYKLYGAQHYDHYDFLLALSDRMSGIGLEHHRSSENGMAPEYFTEWDERWFGRDLLAHEFNHSWNGKYRRGADLATPNFNVPMGDSLLWVYEGQTQYWGNMIAVRAGLVSKEHGLDELAHVAATYDMNRPGRHWRNLQDTTNDPVIAERASLPYDNYQMSEDYYSGGQLVWLAVDAKLRELSRNRHSLDDFAKAFFGMNDGDWAVNPYTFEDVVAALNGIEPFAWSDFLRQRLDGHEKLTSGIAASGWKLVYTDEPSAVTKAIAKRRHRDIFTWSVGFDANDKGELGDVRWDGPAFKAGLAPGMKLIAVNGQAYSADVLKDAITAAKDVDEPIKLLIKEFDRYRTLNVDYHEGLKYPHLERIKGEPDYLSDILEAR